MVTKSLKNGNILSSCTFNESIEFYEKRVKFVNLIWCCQVFNQIDTNNKRKNVLKINDIGCCYFQFYKELKRRKAINRYNYRGYDLDKEYINLGLKYFPELKRNYTVVNIENFCPRKTDISIISAFLEHTENPRKILNYLFKSTSDRIILRTFFGDNNIVKLQDDKKFVARPYYINQFSWSDIINIFLENGFSPEIFPDKATNNSSMYEVGEGSKIFRQMYILNAKRIK